MKLKKLLAYEVRWWKNSLLPWYKKIECIIRGLIIMAKEKKSELTQEELEQELFDAEYKYLKKVAKLFKIKIADWSTLIPFDWNEAAFEGKKKLYYKSIYGPETTIELPENPTFADIWKGCDKIVLENKDYDHRYIEDLEENGEIIKVHFGS